MVNLEYHLPLEESISSQRDPYPNLKIDDYLALNKKSLPTISGVPGRSANSYGSLAMIDLAASRGSDSPYLLCAFTRNL